MCLCASAGDFNPKPNPNPSSQHSATSPSTLASRAARRGGSEPGSIAPPRRHRAAPARAAREVHSNPHNCSPAGPAASRGRVEAAVRALRSSGTCARAQPATRFLSRRCHKGVCLKPECFVQGGTRGFVTLNSTWPFCREQKGESL